MAIVPRIGFRKNSIIFLRQETREEALAHSGRLAGHEKGRSALHCHWIDTCRRTADQEARCTGDGQRVAIA